MYWNLFFISSIFLLQNVAQKKIHKRISFYSKPVCCLSRLCGCNQYLLSGQQWHIIYLQETIPVFMYELNMPRRHRWRLHICNRSSRKDWHTAVNSIQTWLGPNWRMNAPSLWARWGEEGQERYWQGISAPWAGRRAPRVCFYTSKASGGKGADFVTRTYNISTENVFTLC